MSESIIIGVDHGYAAMKTAHFAFPSGLVAYEHEPYTLSNVLEYGGKFYVAGSGRQPLQKAAHQFWPGQKSLPRLPVPGCKAGVLPL